MNWVKTVVVLLACEQALHLGKSQEVTQEQHTKVDLMESLLVGYCSLLVITEIEVILVVIKDLKSVIV